MVNVQNEKKVLKAKREKDQLTHKGRFTRIIPDLSMKARRMQMDVLETDRPQMAAQSTIPSKTINHTHKKFIIKPNLNIYDLANELYRRHQNSGSHSVGGDPLWGQIRYVAFQRFTL